MSELWKQCAGWLLRLEVLPENHRVVWPDATIEDVAYTLRDGVLLCHVANAIDPAAIDMKKVNQRPQMAQFLCLKNIRWGVAAECPLCSNDTLFPTTLKQIAQIAHSCTVCVQSDQSGRRKALVEAL